MTRAPGARCSPRCPRQDRYSLCGHRRRQGKLAAAGMPRGRPGRVAQWESTRLTSEGSQVRTLPRPPHLNSRNPPGPRSQRYQAGSDIYFWHQSIGPNASPSLRSASVCSIMPVPLARHCRKGQGRAGQPHPVLRNPHARPWPLTHAGNGHGRPAAGVPGLRTCVTDQSRDVGDMSG